MSSNRHLIAAALLLGASSLTVSTALAKTHAQGKRSPSTRINLKAEAEATNAVSRAALSQGVVQTQTGTASNAPAAAAVAPVENALPADALKIEKGHLTPAPEGTTASGAYMQITPATDLQLIGARAFIADQVLLAEVLTEGETTRARVPQAIALPAGQTTTLSGTGQYIVLTQLAAPLPEGSEIPVTLLFAGPNGSVQTFDVRLPVAKKPK